MQKDRYCRGTTEELAGNRKQSVTNAYVNVLRLCPMPIAYFTASFLTKLQSIEL